MMQPPWFYVILICSALDIVMSTYSTTAEKPNQSIMEDTKASSPVVSDNSTDNNGAVNAPGQKERYEEPNARSFTKPKSQGPRKKSPEPASGKTNATDTAPVSNANGTADNATVVVNIPYRKEPKLESRSEVTKRPRLKPYDGPENNKTNLNARTMYDASDSEPVAKTNSTADNATVTVVNIPYRHKKKSISRSLDAKKPRLKSDSPRKTVPTGPKVSNPNKKKSAPKMTTRSATTSKTTSPSKNKKVKLCEPDAAYRAMIQKCNDKGFAEVDLEAKTDKCRKTEGKENIRKCTQKLIKEQSAVLCRCSLSKKARQMCPDEYIRSLEKMC